MTNEWRDELLGQLDFYWEAHFWPRLAGLTDDEYWWEPAGRGWSLRERDGELALEQFAPEPPVPPVTTIAWRLVHVGRDIFGKRARAFFGPTPAPDKADMFDDRHWPEPLPGTAADALTMVETGYRMWRDGVAALDDHQLRQPLGTKGGEFAEFSMAALVLHLNREVMAHGAEICLLRDLYRAYRIRELPLVAAAFDGDVDAVGAELARDPAVVQQVSCSRPELVAEVAALRHWGVVRLLVDHGGDAGAGSPSGLHYASAAGAADTARLLVEHGASTTAVDADFGQTPAGWADHFGHPDLAAYLRRSSSQ